MTELLPSHDTAADRNWRRFVLFRVLFNSRFYYPVLAILFLDLGLSPTQYTLLNFAWALAIVFSDIPAGVLADRIGRKPLVVAATVCMVGEMVLLLLAPRNGGTVLFLFCLANRITSGIAEGMASGADEALVFDSLAERNRSAEWPQVLAQVMRWQSVGMVIAMLVGGAVYDPAFMTRACAAVGITVHLEQGMTLRFPILLNLLSALAALVVVLGLREPKVKERHAAPVEEGKKESYVGAVEMILSAGRWIWRTPVALFVIVACMLLDSVVRIFLTFSSSYFRLISLPEAIFGLLGAGLGGLGMVVSPLARRMIESGSLLRNYVILAVVSLVSLVGVALQWKTWGVLFMIPLGSAMTAVGFMVSYYLNALVESHRRATVLSFEGMTSNLGYGFISLLFALVLRAFRDGGSGEQALANGFRFLPVWLAFTLVLLTVGFWKHRAELRKRF